VNSGGVSPEPTQTGGPHAANARQSFRLTEGVIIVLLPVAAYVLTFAYEAGYLWWFGVPYWLVRIDATHILVTATASAVGISSIFYYARFAPAIPWALLYLLLFSFFFGVLGLQAWSTLHFELTWRTFWLAAFGLGCFAAAILSFWHWIIQPIRLYTDSGTWKERWNRKVFEILARSPRASVADKIVDKSYDLLGATMNLVLVGLAASCVALALWGAQRAATNTVYLAANTTPPCAAIRRYGEGVLCVAFDSTAHRLTGGFRVLPFSDTARVFQIRVLGRLSR
jgi:hypothetical protein